MRWGTQEGLTWEESRGLLYQPKVCHKWLPFPLKKGSSVVSQAVYVAGGGGPP